MRGALLAFLLVLPARAARDGEGWAWRDSTTPHFLIKHQASWLPAGFSMGAERVHSRLRMDLGMFSPWMAKEKINLFIYADNESFLKGEFAPPKWSNGLAIYERKAVAMPTMKDPRKMLQVMAHETTHLLFDSYWKEVHREPPSWINEGLAMLEEADSPDRPETSNWYQQMAYADPKRFADLETFFLVSPTKDLHDNQTAVAEWYVQAYSVTHFLLRKHSRLQFKSLCTQLRDGKPVAEALWLTYRYKKVSDLDKKWRAWLNDPMHKRRVAALAGDARKGVDESVVGKSGGLKSSSFKNFTTGFAKPAKPPESE
ncbi:MAG: hypothetical protein HY923_03035 [Elusimicrobia bacterium]|nr:hypothetical protein [Elusimicrobiota bacterium]